MTTHHTDSAVPSPYLTFSRSEWCQYRLEMPLPLSEDDIKKLHGTIEMVSSQEIEDIYLPLSRLLSFHVTATQQLHQVTSHFLSAKEPKVPFIIGVTGSVAVGKSTTSRVLQALLSHWPNHPRVSIITTDGFLFPSQKLEAQGLMHRKGFPESYNVEKLIAVLHALKSGCREIEVPIYSHHTYDIVPDEFTLICEPDIVIVEGLNILQTRSVRPFTVPQIFVSDYFDFTLYVDADTDLIKNWYIERVMAFCAGPFQDPSSYFHHLTKLNQEEVIKFAERVWREINAMNLLENILPYRNRAQLILCKDEDHHVQHIKLRKL